MFTRALTANANALRGTQALAARASSLGLASGKLKWHQRVLEDEAYIQRLAAADMVLGTSNIYVDVYARTYTPWLPHPIFICRRVYVYIPCLPPAGAGHILAQLHRHGAGCALGGDPGRQHGVLARVLARRRLGLDCRGDPAGVGAGPARLCRGRACARAPQVCLVCLPCVSALCVCLMCLPYVSAYVSDYAAVARALVRRRSALCVCLVCLLMCVLLYLLMTRWRVRSWALASSKRGGMSSGGGWQRRATRPCLTHGAGSPLGSAGLPWRWMRTSMPVQAVAACMRVTRVASMSLRQGKFRWRTQGRGRLTESEHPVRVPAITVGNAPCPFW